MATDFPAQLRALRTQANMSQQELADKTGLERKSIIRYENGQGSPNSKALLALGQALGVSVSELLGEVDELGKALLWLDSALWTLHKIGIPMEFEAEAMTMIKKHQGKS